jgi:hypothetical protein
MKPVRNLFRHYSAWCLWALAAVGGLWEFVPAFRDDLPPWIIPILAFAGLVAKLIPQGAPDDGKGRWNRPW